MSGQNVLWRPVFTVEKYDDDGRFIERITKEGNLLTNAGISRIVGLLTGASVAPLDETHVRLGVGNADTVPQLTDTGLGGEQYYAVMLDGFPQVSGNVITMRTEYGPDDANFAWNSAGIDVDNAGSVTSGASPAGLLNRTLITYGEKAGGTWPLTVTITIVNQE